MNLQASSVIKVGGSLLGLPDLTEKLANFLKDFARPRQIVIPGGGKGVDLIREWDRVYDLGEESCHWLALRVLSINSRVLEKLLASSSVAVSPDDCESAWKRCEIPIYDPYHFIADVDDELTNPLPRRWRVTSDSIAARMATVFEAPELILLKSTSVPEDFSLAEASESGLVDPHFATAAYGVPRIVVVNLRENEVVERVLEV